MSGSETYSETFLSEKNILREKSLLFRQALRTWLVSLPQEPLRRVHDIELRQRRYRTVIKDQLLRDQCSKINPTEIKDQRSKINITPPQGAQGVLRSHCPLHLRPPRPVDVRIADETDEVFTFFTFENRIFVRLSDKFHNPITSLDFWPLELDVLLRIRKKKETFQELLFHIPISADTKVLEVHLPFPNFIPFRVLKLSKRNETMRFRSFSVASSFNNSRWAFATTAYLRRTLQEVRDL